MNNTMCNIFTRTAIRSVFLTLCLWVLSGCLANPTPHPGSGDFESSGYSEPGASNTFEEGDASHSSVDGLVDVLDAQVGDDDVVDGVDCDQSDNGGPLSDMQAQSAEDCGPRATEEPQG